MSSYFYKGQRLATKLTAGKTSSVFAGAEFVLGEICEKTQLLLAADRQNSIIKVRNSRCYSPYGFDEVASRESLLGYNGEHRDVMSGYDLLGNGVRAYSSVLMRFCSADVLSPFGAGGINAYAYCEGDPINYLDTDGRMRERNPSSARANPKRYGISQRSHAIKTGSQPGSSSASPQNVQNQRGQSRFYQTGSQKPRLGRTELVMRYGEQSEVWYTDVARGVITNDKVYADLHYKGSEVNGDEVLLAKMILESKNLFERHKYTVIGLVEYLHPEFSKPEANLYADRLSTNVYNFRGWRAQYVALNGGADIRRA